MKKIIQTALIFIVVFAIFYFLFTGGFARVWHAIMPQEETSGELMQELNDRYYGVSPFWIERYGISVTEEADVEADADNDGLTLKQEYTYLTHPFDADSDNDGYDDGREVENGYSPTGEGKMDMNNNGLDDKWEEQYGALELNLTAEGDHDGDLLNNMDEFRYGTDPVNTDTDGDGYDDGREVQNGYDPAAPGEARIIYTISINKLGVDAPIILAESAVEEDLQKDLERGVIHYPDMVMPGQVGNSYIAGHSSNYSWSRGSYNYIFKDLIKLVPGDRITVKQTLANGKVASYQYDVTLQQEVAADEPAIFADANQPQLTLTTCWPLGTAQNRIMVKAVLVETV